MSLEPINRRFFGKDTPNKPQNWEVIRERFAKCQSADELFNIVLELTESCESCDSCDSCGFGVDACLDADSCNEGILKFLKQEIKDATPNLGVMDSGDRELAELQTKYIG